MDNRTTDSTAEQEDINTEFSEPLDLRVARVWLGKDGIKRAIVKDTSEHSLEDAKEMIEGLGRVGGGGKHPVLMDLRRISKSSDREARQYYASAEAARYSQGVALLVDSSVTQVIVNFFFRLNKPEYPTRMFSSEEEALAWLKQLLPPG